MSNGGIPILKFQRLTVLDNKPIFVFASDVDSVTYGVSLEDLATNLSPFITGAAGGADTQIQFNNNDALDGDINLTYDTASDVMKLGSLSRIHMGAISENSAALGINSTIRGFLMPRMTTVQRDAIASPATGLEIYNTDTVENEFFNGTSWQAGGQSAQGPLNALQFNSPLGSFNGSSNLTWDGSTLAITGVTTATSFNGVPLTTSGSAANFLDETGNYNNVVAGSDTQVQFNNAGVLDGSANLIFDGTQVGIGPGVPAAPDGTLHVHTASAGAIGPSSFADDLVVENSTDGGIAILTPDADLSTVEFGSPSRQTGARLRWDFTNNEFLFGTGNTDADLVFQSGLASEAMRIDSSGTMDVVGDITAPTFNSVPLTALGVDTNFLNETGAYSALPFSPLTRIIYVDTGSASGGNGGINKPFNTISSANTAITDATLDNPYTLLIAGDDTNVPTAFKDFIYYKGAGTRDTTVLKGNITDNNALTVLFENLTIEDEWIIGDGSTVQKVSFINTVFTLTSPSNLVINSDGTGASFVNFIENTFRTGSAVNIRTKIFNTERNHFDGGLNLNSSSVEALEDMFVFMDGDLVEETLSFITILSRPMVAKLTNVRVTNAVVFGLVAGANLTLELDEPTYESMLRAGTNFNIPNINVVLNFDAIVEEEFSSLDSRFFGELGLPSLQGWTDTEAGSSTITLSSETVLGVTADVVLYTAATGDAVGSKLSVSAANWTDILTFGASYSGLCRFQEDVGTNKIFSGVGFSAANDPRTPQQARSRVGVFIGESGLFTSIQLEGTSLIVLDGTGGVPLVLLNDYFLWEIQVEETPDAGVNFGAANLIVNGVEIANGGIISSNNAVDNVVAVQNSSGSGSTIFAFSNFGITIYTESNIRTLEQVTMQAREIVIFTPRGKRDYTITLPNGNPRSIGALLTLQPANLLGEITLTNQNLSAPQILYNGLRTVALPISNLQSLIATNTINDANNYIGFGLNVAEGGAYTMSNVGPVTTITAIDDPVKINTDGLDESYNLLGFEHTANRLTKKFPGVKKYLVSVNGSGRNADAGNNDGRIHLFKNGVELTPSAVTGAMTLDASSDDSAGLTAIVSMDITDFIEAFIENNSNDEDFECSDLNVTLIEFG